MVEIGLRIIIKTLFLILLIILFWVYYLRGVYAQFQAELVNTSVYEEKVSEQEFPDLTICAESMFKTQKIEDKYNSIWYGLFYSVDYLDPSREIIYSEMWNDAIYKLNQDFEVTLTLVDGDPGKY